MATMTEERRSISIRGVGFGNVMLRTGCFACSFVLAYNQWKDWGVTWECNSCLFAEATCGDLKLCVKIAINLEKEPFVDPESSSYATRIPGAAHVRVAQRFLDEYKFYRDQLKDLQGKLVPRHYGLWRFNSTWGGVVLLSIFEWAGSPSFTLFRTLVDKDTTEHRLACIKAISQLHAHGIEHAQLFGISNIRHVLFDVETETPRIVDFAAASARHKCMLPMFPSKYGNRDHPGCCDEVGAVARALQYYTYVPPSEPSTADCGPTGGSLLADHMSHSLFIAASG
ncbi:hypothetical protein HGRIS_007266 [Hohenbuehelia grisea]|uniref:Protein kinase domain-containing protein n=1 Tax=Hohenbuehelia grisea TaxID=104357 RepID=A0ABR3JCR4_9AGAR